MKLPLTRRKLNNPVGKGKIKENEEKKRKGKKKRVEENREWRRKKREKGSDSRCSYVQNSLVQELKLVYSKRATSRCQKQKR